MPSRTMHARGLIVALATSLLTACASSGGTAVSTPESGVYDSAQDLPLPSGEQRDPRCESCGVVERIERSGGADTLQGGIVGGVLSGEDKPAPAKPAAPPSFRISVRLDDGSLVVVTQRDLSGVRAGSYVEVRDGRADLRNR